MYWTQQFDSSMLILHCCVFNGHVICNFGFHQIHKVQVQSTPSSNLFIALDLLV